MISEYECEVTFDADGMIERTERVSGVGIYAFICIPNGKIYIGSSRNLRVRIYSHMAAMRRKKHDNEIVNNAAIKYGTEAFRFYVIKKCSEEVLVTQEDLHIEKYRSMFSHGGFNLLEARGGFITGPKGPTGMSPRKKEVLERLAEMKRGKPMPESWRQAIRDGHAKRTDRRPWYAKLGLPNPFKGKRRIFSEEHRKNMSESSKRAFREGARKPIKVTPSHVVEEIIRLVRSGMVYQKVADTCGVSQSCVSCWAAKNGIIRRPRKQAGPAVRNLNSIYAK